ncbi:hypothetical protein M9Y10_011972 [Tritrichomonas musculus]|uniref:Uncharacterized protein n=1 Tax=Tritrichomonas musculus TaxID=1915356 RepID=A0ABR2ICC3_9EUKA
MADSTQKERLENYIKDILEACKNDPLRTEVAISNLKALSNAIKEYEEAPKYYNTMFETKGIPNSVSSQKATIESEYKFPVVGELEKIYSKKLKQAELLQLSKQLSPAIGVKISREATRSKLLLLQWFSLNWEAIRPKITELNLDKMVFDEPK